MPNAADASTTLWLFARSAPNALIFRTTDPKQLETPKERHVDNFEGVAVGKQAQVGQAMYLSHLGTHCSARDAVDIHALQEHSLCPAASCYRDGKAVGEPHRD